MHFPNQQLINQVKKTEHNKYRILPRCSARLTTTNKQVDDEIKGGNLKILHYHNKFWKTTPGSYLIKVTGIRFSEDFNESASKRARATRGGGKSIKKKMKAQ
jgi:hypothetical protein